MSYIDPNQDPNAPMFDATPEFQTPPGGGFAGRDNSDTSGGNVMPGGPGFDNQGFIAAATQSDGSADGTRKNVSSGLPDLSGPTPSPYDLVAQATGAGNPAPDGGGSPYDVVARGIANAPATPPGQTGRPLTAEERAFQNANPNGGSFTNPQAGAQITGNGRPLTVEEQYAQGQVPNGGTISATGGVSALPGGPGGPSASDLTNAAPASAAGDRILRNADGSIRGVKDASGYYSGDAWSGYDNIINNAQRSDPFAIEKVKYLAGQGDARAQTVLGGIPQNFDQSQNYADWAAAHNAEIKGNTTGNNPNHIGDVAQIPNNPLPNSEVFKVQDAWGKVLTSEGRTGVTIDTYGNVVYDNSNGGKNIITPGWQAAQELAAYLQQKASAPPVAPPSGGGGYPPRGNGYAPPRGGGGGNGPSAPAAPRAIFDSQAHRDAAAAHAGNVPGITDYGNTNFQPTAPVDGGGPVGQNLGNVTADFTGPQNQPGGQGNTDAQNLGNVVAQFPDTAPPQAVNSLPDWYRIAQQKGFLP